MVRGSERYWLIATAAWKPWRTGSGTGRRNCAGADGNARPELVAAARSRMRWELRRPTLKA
ncbi:hypothetical protein GCM10010260_30370 [Streptomyces filipinensis]|uniref:Uncharacterized protein n=1 Tax=Streptomyces filipinensis TaxID=66887 RepID=A0A918MBL4_9ACTN|nr:hypothetical protein GCM10010260_30370 [Streptomyces filipinensis]